MKNTFVIPDLHLPFEIPGALEFCKRVYKDFNCTKVVMIGDLVDNHAISYHEHDPDGKSPADEMAEVDVKLKEWFKAFPNVKLCRGNHDCYSSDTEILTGNGWKRGISLNDKDVVATLNLKTNLIEYQKPYALIKKEYNGEMVRFNSQHGLDLLVTPSHRMVISSKDTKIDEPIYHIKLAHELNKAYRYLPVSGENENEESGVDDDMLRLLAWVLTDGYIKDNGYAICQSKVKNLDGIERVLESCGCPFKKVTRARDIKSICGVELKKQPLPQNEYHFKSVWLDGILKGDKHTIPEIVWNLNTRQFTVFLDTIIDGDGTSYSERRGDGSRSSVVHGTKEFLDQLQALCVQNKCHASMRVFREKDYRLNIVPNRIKIGHTTGCSIVEYSGLVWCASVDNGTLVVRRGGNIAIQGNCLVDRKRKTAGLPERAFKPFREIWNLPKGWEDDWEFIIDGIKYIHGTGYSGKFGHVNAAYDHRMSVVMGHLHSTAGVEFMANNQDLIFGMCVGCLLDKRKYAFTYGRDFKRKPILGAGVVSVTKRGVNAQFIPFKL